MLEKYSKLKLVNYDSSCRIQKSFVIKKDIHFIIYSSSIQWWGGAVVKASDCWSQGQQFEPCSAHRAKGERCLKPKQLE